MEFRILGPVDVVDDGRVVALGPSKQRALLVVLLLHLNEVVSRDRLIEDLWGEHAPETAATALHGYVSQLRKVLEASDGAERRVLVTRAPGYLLELDPGQVDLKRFELLARRGKRELATGEAGAAAAALAEALSLWRGPPLAEFSSAPFALAESLRLEELLVSTLEDRIEADLALGRHDDLVGELETLVAEHPFRERLCRQLMLALYRCGRQAEALEVYRKTRRKLVDELGIEPGPALQDLEQAILRHEQAIAPVAQTGTGKTIESPRPVAEPIDRGVAAAPEQGPRRARRPALGSRLLAVIGLVLLAVGLGLAFMLNRGRPASILLTSNSVGFVDAKSGRVTRSFPVGRAPSALTVANNSVWVANYRDETVTRIDRTTGRGITIAVGGHPTGIAAFRSAVWVWTSEGLLVRIDSRYDTAGHPVRLGPVGGTAREPGRITAGAGFLWITVPDATVLRIDAAHPERRRSIVPDWGAGGPVIERNGRAWVAGSSFAGYVFPIDARTGAPGTAIDVGGPVHDLALGARSLWVVSGGAVREQPHPALRAVDLHDRLVRTTVAVGKDPVAVVTAAGSIWVAGRGDETVSRVDSSRARVVETIKLGAHPTALAADREGVWVAVA
jgi:DNA-binding SARP family transcriptional activator/DNA-binding beta-propeller fold protein YncE